MKTLTIKAGDSLELSAAYANEDGAAVDLTAYTITSEVRRTPGRELVETLAVEIAADQTEDGDRGVFTLSASAEATAEWPLGQLVCDVKFVSDDVVRSETFAIAVVEAITE